MELSLHREFIGDRTGIERQSLLRPFTDPHGLRGMQYGGQRFRSRNGKLVILMEFLPAPPGSAETHQKISGNYLAHQIPLPNAKTDPAELAALESWLQSYHFAELFNPEKGFTL